jgi:outer membrane protein TolC
MPSAAARLLRARRLLHFMLGALLASAPATLQAQSPSTPVPADSLPITLGEALARATGQSQEVRLARSQVAYANSQVRAARSGALPQIDATVAYTRTYESPFSGRSSNAAPPAFAPDSTLPLDQRVAYLEKNAPNAALSGMGSLFGNLPFGQPNSYTASITGTQTLFAGGRVGAALHIADEYRGAATLMLTEQVADIELATRTAYYNALLAQELERISAAAVTQAEAFLAQEQLRRRAGTASELDVLRAEVALENLRPPLVAARNAASVATLNLKRLVDIPLTQPVVLTTPLVMPSAEELVTPTVDASVLLAQRAAVQAQERQVAIREQQVRIAKGAFLPSAGLSVTYGKQIMPQRVFGFDNQSWLGNFSATIGVNVPIFSGFRRQAELQQADIQLDQERLRLGQLKENVQLQYEQALGEKQRAAADLTARQRTVAQAQRVYDMTVLRYEKGLATQLEVSDARFALLQARTNLAQAISGFHLADAGVSRASGAPVPARASASSPPAAPSTTSPSTAPTTGQRSAPAGAAAPTAP